MLSARPAYPRPWPLPSSSSEHFAHLVSRAPHSCSSPPTLSPFLLIFLHVLLSISTTFFCWRSQGPAFGSFLFSTCPTPLAISFSPSRSQSPTDDSQVFISSYNLSLNSRLMDPNAYSSSPFGCLIDTTNTDILIHSHPKLCSSIKFFPSRWLGNSALPVVQTKNLRGILDSLSFTL